MVTGPAGRARLAGVWEELLSRQSGVIARRQALACGLTGGAIRRRLQAGKWRPLLPGVYATFTGPVPRSAVLWAAVLRAGPGAVLSHETAAELLGLVDAPAEVARQIAKVLRRNGWPDQPRTCGPGCTAGRT